MPAESKLNPKITAYGVHCAAYSPKYSLQHLYHSHLRPPLLLGQKGHLIVIATTVQAKTAFVIARVPADQHPRPHYDHSLSQIHH